MLPVSEILPKAAYYLIQRRDSRQTPLTASLITQFRRECGYLQKLKLHKKIESVDIRQTLQYTQQCIRVLNPALSPLRR